MEHRDQRLEVALAGRRQERLDQPALLGEVRIGVRVRRPQAPPGPARELARRVGAAVDDRGDLIEGHPEGVVQDEGEPFRRPERFEHHQEGEADRIGDQRLVLGIGAVDRVDDRVRHPLVERLLAPRVAGAQHVQGDPRDHRGQPGAEVLDRLRVTAVEPQPGLLHGVVGLGGRAHIR